MATGACLIMARSCGASGSFCNGTFKAPNVQAADTARYYRNLDLDQMGWLSDQPDLTVKERPEIRFSSAVTANCSSAVRRRQRPSAPTPVPQSLIAYAGAVRMRLARGSSRLILATCEKGWGEDYRSTYFARGRLPPGRARRPEVRPPRSRLPADEGFDGLAGNRQQPSGLRRRFGEPGEPERANSAATRPKGPIVTVEKRYRL